METVLIVEDEVQIRSLMTRWVKASGFPVVIASTASQALEELQRAPIAVAVCDIHMPGHNGLWLAGEIRQRFPETAVIIATGACEFDTAVSSLRKGAIDYLVKPFAQRELRDAVQKGIDWNHSAVETRSRLRELELELRTRHAELTDAVSAARINSAATLDAMLRMLTAHAPAAYEHAQRVSRLVVDTALLLGITEPLLSDIERGALMHDVGKIAIPEAVLKKPTRLTPEERALIEEHPQLGYDMVRGVPFLERAAEVVLASHEWFDGTGYPRKLAGRQIPIGARILTIADAYDVMTEREQYARRMTQQDAVEELVRCRGTQFDPWVLDSFQVALALGRASSVATIAVKDDGLAEGSPAGWLA